MCREVEDTEVRVRAAIGTRCGALPGALMVPAAPALRALGAVAAEILASLEPARTDEFVRCLRENAAAHREAGTGPLLRARPAGNA